WCGAKRVCCDSLRKGPALQVPHHPSTCLLINCDMMTRKRSLRISSPCGNSLRARCLISAFKWPRRNARSPSPPTTKLGDRTSDEITLDRADRNLTVADAPCRQLTNAV